MTEREFQKLLHRRIAQLAVGASAIRNQGGRGLVKSCRNYFENSIDLNDFFNAVSKEKEYRKFLDNHTNQIVEIFPDGAKSWGAARKGLNLFFRDLAYNTYFAKEYRLQTKFKSNNLKLKNLEIPLDNDVANGLRKYFTKLPKWPGIKNLTSEISDEYQAKAKELAIAKKIARVHLDLEFWRNNK